MAKKKKTKKKKYLIILLIFILIFLLITFYISIDKSKSKQKEEIKKLSQNITILVNEEDISKKKIKTYNKEENIVISNKYIILGNTDILRINDESSIKQVTIYNDIVLVMINNNNNYNLNIYDFNGYLKKEISTINSNGYYRLININNSRYYFNISGDTITIMGTKQDVDGLYMIDENTHINLCEDTSISDDDIVSATFTFKYNNEYKFSNIKYKETSKYVKDVKKCN